MRTSLVILAALAVPRAAAADFLLTFSADPHVGIHRETWKDASIPATVRLMRVDLTNAQVQLVATKPANAGITVGQYAALKGAAVAINGDSFSVSYQPTGLAMGEAMLWPNTADDGTSAVFDFRRAATPTTGEYTVAELVPTGEIVTPQNLPNGTLGVVSGRPLLVRSGAPQTQFDCNDPVTIACQPAPRTALGLSNDGNTLYLAVVDGWQSGSLGLTAAQLAAFMQAHGAADAVALDGGSSSTLVVDNALVSSPSDGIQRAVANHLAVQFAAQANGGIIGLVCSKTISPCNQIVGAALTLDTGATATSDAQGVYNFNNLTPRYTCVKATKTGFYPTERCVVVGPGPTQTYDSIPMQPCPTGGCPPPDAGVIDAAFHYPDAGRLPDGRENVDAGNPEHGVTGGCCGAGRDRPELLLCALVAWFLTRRRGTVGAG